MSRSVCMLLAILATASSVDAQTTASGSVRGVVTDEQGAAVAGVLVVATSATVPGVRQATTDADGGYRLLDLPAGDYAVNATLPGFAEARRAVAMRAGLRTTLDIVMTVGGVAETVEVEHEAPLLDTMSGEHAVNISGELLRSMPLAERREWFGALSLVPGVIATEWANNEKFLYVHGADYSANIVQIDGADVTSAVGFPLAHIGLSTEAIDDIQVKVAGVDASTPLGIGGIINIATASGSNQVRGAASVFSQPLRWNASNLPGGTSAKVDQTQVDLSAGAPVVRDRLWTFAAYRRIDLSSGVSRTPAQLEALSAFIPNFTPGNTINKASLWFGKLTAHVTAAHQLSGFYQYDVNPTSRFDPVSERPRAEAYGGTAASVRLSSVWASRMTTRLGVSFNDKRLEGRPELANAPLERIHATAIRSGGRLVGSGRLVDRQSSVLSWSRLPLSKLTISLDATIFGSNRTGAHEIQTGVYAQPRIQIGQRSYYANGGFVLEELTLRQPGVLASGLVPFHRLVFDDASVTLTRRRGQDFAVYVQDAWKPTPRLTLNAGVRLDRIRWIDQLFDVETQRSWDVGPRFGVNYALTSDVSNIVRGHWVRVHDQPISTGTSVGASAPGRRDLYDLDLDGTFETVFVTPATLALTAARSIDPELHAPSVREWGLGYSRQFRGALTVGADFVHRDFTDLPTLVETNGQYAGRVFTGYRDEAFNALHQLTNNSWNWPVYSSLDLSVTKRASWIQGIASYVRQWRHIAGTWQPHDPASFIQPDAFPNNRSIGSTAGTASSPEDANSLSGTSMTQRSTLSAQWQDHVVRLGVTMSPAWGLQFATNYTFQSGAWEGPHIAALPAPDPAFGPSTVTLPNGRVVDNPLAATFRFAYPTRAEGQRTTPDLHVWNVRLGHSSRWRRVRVDVSLDVFNLTNNAADTSFQSGSNQTFSPAFGTTTFRQVPRSGQVGIRATF